MLDLLNKCFGGEMKAAAWRQIIKEMVPTYGQSLAQHNGLCRRVRERTGEVLKLTD